MSVRYEEMMSGKWSVRAACVQIDAVVAQLIKTLPEEGL